MSAANLSIIIVNYKSEQLILDALESFLPASQIQPEVIIVDNDSGQDRLFPIQQRFPSVRILQMGYNAGFARANNLGIKSATHEVVLLLNPDTLAPAMVIDRCFQKFTGTDYIACGVQLLNADGSPQISDNYFMRGGLNNLLPLTVIGKLIKWAGQLFGVKKPNLPDSNSLVEVDWINGAFLMVKKTAIASAGLLDEDFFLYAEEIEWCSRLAKTGRLCIFGDLKLIHLQGETANQSFSSSGKGYYNLFDKKGLQILISNFLRIRKQFGAVWFIFHLLVYFLEIPLLYIFSLLGLFTPKIGIRFSMARSYTSNYWELLKLVPRMLSNRPYFYKTL